MLGQYFLAPGAALVGSRRVLAAWGLVGILIVGLVLGNKLALASTNEVGTTHLL